MKAKNTFTRISKAVDGASEALAPRSHALEPADGQAKQKNPQRMDILRRHILSSRNKSNDNA